MDMLQPVSYTHLDVYKRQAYILKEHRIAFAYDPASKYVRSIGEVAEFDHGSGSGWLYLSLIHI